MRTLRIVPQKCTGCDQCRLVCSFVQMGEFQPSHAVIKVRSFEEQVRFSPYTCFQCAEAWCMKACPVNAITIDPNTDARVVVTPACVGCALCTIICPYGTIYMNPTNHKATKCNLCHGAPACVKTCPTGAIEFVELEEPQDWTGSWAEENNQPFLLALARGDYNPEIQKERIL